MMLSGGGFGVNVVCSFWIERHQELGISYILCKSYNSIAIAIII